MVTMPLPRVYLRVFSVFFIILLPLLIETTETVKLFDVAFQLDISFFIMCAIGRCSVLDYSTSSISPGRQVLSNHA